MDPDRLRLLARSSFAITYGLVLAISIFMFVSTAVAGLLIVSLLLIALGGYLLGVSSYSFGTGYVLWIDTFGVVNRSSDDERTWLSLHFIYGIAGWVNLIITLSVLVASVIIPTLLGWAVITGSMAILGQLTLYALLRMLGQGYEDLSGASFSGVVAIARLSARMVNARNRKGILYLLGSLRMLRALFTRRGHMPEDLSDVIATVESESEVKDPNYPLLETLGTSLQGLPDRRQLPLALQDFLTEMKWPEGFKTFQPSRIRVREILSVGFSAVVAIGAISLIFPVESRSFFESMIGFLIQHPLLVLVVPLVVSFFIASRAIAFLVPYRLSKRYLEDSESSKPSVS